MTLAELEILVLALEKKIEILTESVLTANPNVKVVSEKIRENNAVNIDLFAKDDFLANQADAIAAKNPVTNPVVDPVTGI